MLYSTIYQNNELLVKKLPNLLDDILLPNLLSNTEFKLISQRHKLRKYLHAIFNTPAHFIPSYSMVPESVHPGPLSFFPMTDQFTANPAIKTSSFFTVFISQLNKRLGIKS